MRVHSVLTAVNLDYHPLIEADEVDNEIIDRRLSAKMKSVRQPKRLQTSPQLALMRRLLIT
jgi:hypothetical protein